MRRYFYDIVAVNFWKRLEAYENEKFEVIENYTLVVDTIFYR